MTYWKCGWPALCCEKRNMFDPMANASPHICMSKPNAIANVPKLYSSYSVQKLGFSTPQKHP